MLTLLQNKENFYQFWRAWKEYAANFCSSCSISEIYLLWIVRKFMTNAICCALERWFPLLITNWTELLVIVLHKSDPSTNPSFHPLSLHPFVCSFTFLSLCWLPDTQRWIRNTPYFLPSRSSGSGIMDTWQVHGSHLWFGLFVSNPKLDHFCSCTVWMDLNGALGETNEQDGIFEFMSGHSWQPHIHLEVNFVVLHPESSSEDKTLFQGMQSSPKENHLPMPCMELKRK